MTCKIVIIFVVFFYKIVSIHVVIFPWKLFIFRDVSIFLLELPLISII